MRAIYAPALVGVAIVLATGCGDASDPGALGDRGSLSTNGRGDANGHDPADPGEQENGVPDPSATSAPPAPSDPGKAAATFGIALDNVTPQSNLGEAVSFSATLTPTQAGPGQATLSISGLPPEVTAAIAPTALPLDAGPVKAKVTLSIGFGATPSVDGVPIVISAVAEASTATANANFKVNNAVTLRIPAGIDAMNAIGPQPAAYGGAFTGGGSAPTYKTGLVVFVFNEDSAPHILHGSNGFAHGDSNNPIQPNQYEMQNGTKRMRTLVAGTIPNGYLHAANGTSPNGTNAPFRFKVQ